MESISGPRIIAVSFVLLALVFSAFLSGSVASDEDDVAVSAILAAEDSISLAYQAVLEAEEAGANVSRLLARLNVAGEYLAEAHVALRIGDFAGVIDDADRCIEIAEKVEADAVELKERAPRERRQHLLSSMMHSMIAIGVIAVGSVIGWYVFKVRYQPRILEGKLEVKEDGAERVS